MKCINVGDTASASKSFSYEDVKLFSEISGDLNPIHLDEKFAEDSIFKKRIVHGFLYTSLISNVIANHLPGPGSIYLHQEMDFIKPVFHDEKVKAEVTVIEVNAEKNIVHLQTNCYKQDDILIVKGKAIIKVI